MEPESNIINCQEASEVLPEDQQEEENDVNPRTSDFDNITTMTTDWTIETIVSQITKGNILLDPPFQRRIAWDDSRKSRLIESFIIGIPVPGIVLASKKGTKKEFIVIDGKQRLFSISSFLGNEFFLKNLTIRGDLQGKKFEDLEDAERASLENTTMRSTVINSWKSDKALYSIFFRLNSGSLPLSPQELRKALIPGNTIDSIEAFIENSKGFRSIFGTHPDKRMRDSEIILRYLAFSRECVFGPANKGDENCLYKGNMKEFLDNATIFYNENPNELANRLSNFEKVLAICEEIFGQDVFRKFSGGKVEPRINRAVYDIVTRFFSDKYVAEKSLIFKENVKREFTILFKNDEFLRSVSTTTKSFEATALRFDSWGRKLSSIIGCNYDEFKKLIRCL